MKADLHIHSGISDGSFTRLEIIELAKKKGLSHIAFSDHDCTDGFEECAVLSQRFGVKIIPAIEISAYDFKTGRKAHILGYDYKDPAPLKRLCEPILKKRNENCLKQIAVLADMGYKITADDVRKFSGRTIYKQHILKYLYDSKQSTELFGEVYKSVFKNGGRCDFDIVYCDAADAVKAVKQSGGLAVLAHSGQQQNFDIVPELVKAGLDGLELNHPSNGADDMQKITELADRYGLFTTGGSDFHGEYEQQARSVGDFLSPENPLTV